MDEQCAVLHELDATLAMAHLYGVWPQGLYTGWSGLSHSSCVYWMASPYRWLDTERPPLTGALLGIIKEHGRPTETCVLLERTGHYGQALEQFLQDHGVKTYRILAQTRYGKNKTDKHDARALAAMLYSQVELHAPVVNEKDRVWQIKAPSDAASCLRGHVHRRYELVNESTQRRNQLTAICDELFPEFTEVYTDPNSESALQLREKFPTPQACASASIDDLCATRKHTRPSRADLASLQQLARATIGTTDHARRSSLLLEQEQLIAELRLLCAHIGRLEDEIAVILETSREGQILNSFPGIGPINGAVLLAGIGSIANFTSSAKLRGYLGWAPKATQTGTSYDSITLDKGGNVLLKRTMYLIAISAIRSDPSWKLLYNRLVERKCDYDARTGKYRGKMKVIGRIAGQIIGVLYVLLRKDYDLLAALAPDEKPPPPELYDVHKHSIRLKAGENRHGSPSRNRLQS